MADEIPGVFARRHPQWASLGVPREDGLEFLDPEGDVALSIWPDEDRYLVWLFDAHAHLDTLDEALSLAGRCLAGEIRSAAEYRGDERASTWMEFKETDYYETHHRSVYLCPFDPDEFELWPGEAWRVVRMWIELNPEGAIGIREMERIAEGPAEDPPELTWLPDALGPPAEEMKWVTGTQPELVFQAPRGWRRRAVYEEPASYVDYSAKDRPLLFRVQCWFKEVEGSSREAAKRSVRPHSVEHKQGVVEDNSDWTAERWTCLFKNSETEMMAIFELWRHRGGLSDRSLANARIGATVSEARLVPHDWRMTKEN